MALPGDFRVQVLTWTGDGSASRAIATRFALDVGKVFVCVQRHDTAGAIARLSTFAAGNSKTDGTIPGVFVTNGITGFTAAGFTIGNNTATNTAGQTYTAVVLQDVSPTGAYMNMGTYVGTAAVHDITGVVSFTPGAVIVWARHPIYKSDLMPAGTSVEMCGGDSVTNEVTALIPGGFSLGLSFNSDSNGSGFTYHWVAFNTALLTDAFKQFSVAGTGAPVATGSIGFTPEWAFAQSTSANHTGGFSRGAAHTGTQSTEWGVGAGAISTTGITALNADTITLGTTLSVSTKTVYGFALRTRYTLPGKFTSIGGSIAYDDAPGGTLRDVTAHVRSIDGLRIESLTEENSPFGQAFDSDLPVGKQQFADVEIAGDVDSTPITGPHVVFGIPDTDERGATRTLTVTPGDRSVTVETRLVSYELELTDETLSGYVAVVRQAGPATWS